jgi:hypothetical protein
MYIMASHHVHVSTGKKIHWTIASARQNLPTVVHRAAREPQDIYRRNTLVARVVSPQGEIAGAPPKPTAAELLADLQRVAVEEDYTLDVPPRNDRPNPLTAPKPSTRTRRRVKRR